MKGKVTQNPNVNVSASLKIYPGIFAYLNLLNMPILELRTAIENKLVENPLLEEEPEVAEKENEEIEIENNSNETEIDFELVEDFFYRDEDEFVYPKEPEDKKSDLWEKITPKELTFYEKLKNQVYPLLEKPEEFLIADYIIENLNEKGFLELEKSDIDEFIESLKEKGININYDKFESVREKIKEIKPYGIGSFNIKESLIFQVDKLELSDEDKRKIKALIEKYAEDLSKGKYEIVEKELNLSTEEIRKYIEIVKKLELFPGEEFSKTAPESVVPDVFIEKDDGNYIVVLNDFHIPKVRISGYYRRLLENMKRLKEEKENRKYMKEMLDDAIKFLKALDYRNKSIYRVSEAIVHFQREFLDKGFEYLKPLKLKDVAEYTGLNEATVSRAISGKYISTSRGLFPFKFFFPKSGVKTKGGKDVLTDKVKEMIREIIKNENKSAPYSDQEIVYILSNKGIRIKRRTVAKYREMMGIPSSKERKRFYKISGGVK